MKTSSVEYNKKHDLKRNAKQKLFKFYLDNEEEKEVYELLDKSDNAKELILKAVSQYCKENN